VATRRAVVIRRRRATRRELCIWALVAVLPVLLDRFVPLGATPHTGAFLGIIVAIASAVATFFQAIGSASLTAILYAWQIIRTGVINLGRVVKTGLWDAGRGVAKVLRSTRALWDRVLHPALQWANDKLLKLEHWLHDKFGPVLKWLHDVKTQLDAFYRTYIRPIIDTIDFVRALNRALQLFHVHVLDSLDKWLVELEARIEEPFLWLRAKITELQNWVDRIVTLDGLFQRLTLIRSLSSYAPDWINGFWHRQIEKDVQFGDPYDRTRDYPLDEPEANGLELGRFYRGEDNRMQADVERLLPIWRVAAGIDPPTGV
jgi:hypothetical protein